VTDEPTGESALVRVRAIVFVDSTSQVIGMTDVTPAS
jgi:hypothetical protein